MTWISDVKFAREVPKLKTGLDLGSLRLTPQEGFVLSRVDGVSTVEELCLLSALPREQTLEILGKLQAEGALEVPGAPDPARAPAAEQGAAGGALGPDGPAGGPVQAQATDASVPPFSPDPGCDLSEDKQREVHELYHRIEELDFYSLLGLHPGCDAKEVQRAYRKISLKYHPDRFFGKKLGSVKDRLETIFRHVSNVAEYLTDDAQRESYEAELGLSATPAPQASSGQEERAQAGPETHPAEGSRAHDAPSRAARPGTSPTTAELEAVGRPRSMTREQRLRKLGGVLGMTTQELKAVARGRSTPTPSGVPELSPERQARITEKAQSSPRKLPPQLAQRIRKAREHYDEGVKAMLAGNWANAASNLKLATTFDPKNQEYRDKEQVASQRARVLAAETYAKRAAFEESVGHLEEAARLFSMAADRNETIDLMTKAAAALVKTGELKRAMDYAMKARDLNPNSVPARIGLASAYLAAGMPKNARRELEYVMKLDSDNPAAKTLMKEVRRAE